MKPIFRDDTIKILISVYSTLYTIFQMQITNTKHANLHSQTSLINIKKKRKSFNTPFNFIKEFTLGKYSTPTE